MKAPCIQAAPAARALGSLAPTAASAGRPGGGRCRPRRTAWGRQPRPRGRCAGVAMALQRAV